MSIPRPSFYQAIRLTQTPTWVCPSCKHKRLTPHRNVSVTTRTPPNRKPLPIMPARKAPKDQPPVLEHLRVPIGQPEIPLPGDNSHYDHRPVREIIEDFFDSREAARQFMKPAFRNYTLMRHHKGKNFLATPKLFRAETSLYFPNMQGYTLADVNGMHDTTNVLRGKYSIVCMLCDQWSVDQANTYTSAQHNPALNAELERLGEKGLQIVNITVMEGWIRRFLVWYHTNWQREQMPESEWARWFVVTKGISDYTMLDINMINAKVGHVFLVDTQCKIRWTGCGDATDQEKQSLVAAVKKLVEGPSASSGAGAGTVKTKASSYKAAEKPPLMPHQEVNSS